MHPAALKILSSTQEHLELLSQYKSPKNWLFLIKDNRFQFGEIWLILSNSKASLIPQRLGKAHIENPAPTISQEREKSIETENYAWKQR